MKTSLLSVVLASAVSAAFATQVTVGASGDYQTLAAALTALRAENADTPGR